MVKALKYTVQIVTAKVSNSIADINKSGGADLAEFIEEIYNKVAELEAKEEKISKMVESAELSEELETLNNTNF